jgi:hypothetical protein
VQEKSRVPRYRADEKAARPSLDSAYGTAYDYEQDLYAAVMKGRMAAWKKKTNSFSI